MGQEFNAAMGELAYASSCYNDASTMFVPANGNDGLTDKTSWWSAGNNATEQVFWQVNMTTVVPTFSRIVVHWHGFLSPRSYRVRVSYDGIEFTTIFAVFNLSNAYDRVDTHTKGLLKVPSKIKYIRLAIAEPNVCSDRYSCIDDGNSSKISETNERVIYGIREMEIWAKGTRNGASRLSGINRNAVALCIVLSLLLLTG